MSHNNVTTISHIHLLGFRTHHGIRLLLFCFLLLVYCGTICGNLLIITLVSTNKNLLTPMYFFLTQLSLSDIVLITNIVPTMLYIVMDEEALMTLAGCITQFYFFAVSECSECLLLTMMSYDRYLAICNPLRYFSIMDTSSCFKFILLSWLVSFSSILVHTIMISKLEFCGPNIIDHFFCDFAPLLELTCSDTFIVKTEVTLLCIPLLIVPFIVVIVSYAFIVYTVLSIRSNAGRHKAFSTCISHLLVVTMYFGTLFCMYVLPTKGQSFLVSKVLSLLYTVVTPLFNPIIYTLRNEDIKNAIRKALKKIM